MNFKDPLATIKHMGGTLGFHIGMALISFNINFLTIPEIECGNSETNITSKWSAVFTDYWDTYVMFTAHCFCILVLMIARSCK